MESGSAQELRDLQLHRLIWFDRLSSLREQPGGHSLRWQRVFYLNSYIQEANIRDGYTNTMLAGERRSNPSVSPAIYGTWIGAPPGGVESIGRVLGAADYAPNDPFNHFEAYSSFHPGGAHASLMRRERAVHQRSVDIQLFMGLATINKHDNAIVFVPR